jgi:hypothetical protein
MRAALEKQEERQGVAFRNPVRRSERTQRVEFLAPRPGLEPETCGLTVRPVIPRKAAPVNDLGRNGG